MLLDGDATQDGVTAQFEGPESAAEAAAAGGRFKEEVVA
jgi:hypothetical protein